MPVSKVFISDSSTTGNIIDSTGIHTTLSGLKNISRLKELRDEIHQYVYDCMANIPGKIANGNFNNDFTIPYSVEPDYYTWMNDIFKEPALTSINKNYIVPFTDLVIFTQWLYSVQLSGVLDIEKNNHTILKSLADILAGTYYTDLDAMGFTLPAFHVVATYYMHYSNKGVLTEGTTENSDFEMWKKVLEKEVIDPKKWNTMMNEYISLIGVTTYNNIKQLNQFLDSFYEGLVTSVAYSDVQGDITNDKNTDILYLLSTVLMFFILGEFYLSGSSSQYTYIDEIGEYKPFDSVWCNIILPKIYNINMQFPSDFNLKYEGNTDVPDSFWSELYNVFIAANASTIISYYEDFGWLDNFYVYEYTSDGIYYNGEKQTLPVWTVL